mmetsp:Transcript_21883/g.56818  ORF Transcript_21883/g.56818 Transcript_21883/m.56818 type:complete len:108 (-) Transcript_21883:1137-1460(-)|eukprot:CAMPEP_0113898750 /NCGR_PEP_ID=MMETSP0780_2-20120614/19594_1 /TAXON_ID=652834 /ORGANISM="Palpitomonas bilix" /LENGTH=107 /DNA_ID=CAMNT_0000890731 /DNA_START=73 /DNA_END=396 /DNA_ORIENTATION=+ /assembly_acc=CAM_ASM_000599
MGKIIVHDDMDDEELGMQKDFPASLLFHDGISEDSIKSVAHTLIEVEVISIIVLLLVIFALWKKAGPVLHAWRCSSSSNQDSKHTNLYKRPRPSADCPGTTKAANKK